MTSNFEKEPDAKGAQSGPESSYEALSVIVENTLNAPLIVKAPCGTIGCATDEGFNYPVPHNEDAVVIDTEKNAFAVIDGMGGGSKGKEAAYILAEEVQTGFAAEDSFSHIRQRAHERIRDELPGENGACFIGGRIEGNTLSLSQAGDVRLIIISKDGHVRLETKDECLFPPFGNVVTNSISDEDAGKNTTYTFALQDGDRIVAGSDGIWDNLTTEEVVELTKGKSVRETILAIEEETRKKMEQGRGPGRKPDNRSLLTYDIETTPLS